MKLKDVKNYSQLQEILEEISWQKFEEIVGKIFEIHGYKVEVSEVITFEGTRRQYDVIARQEDHLIIADCKRWDRKRRIKYGLKQAAEKQINRVKKFQAKQAKYPIVVLSCRSPIEYYHQVPLVSVYKLNKFLLQFPMNKEMIFRVK